MRKIKTAIISLFALTAGLSLAAPVPAAALSPVVNFAACGGNGGFLGFPHWYDHLSQVQTKQGCQPQITKLTDFWVIALNIIGMMFRAAGIVAVGMIIWGGFKYIRSAGDPGTLSEGKSIIMNGLIGLFIVIAAVAILEFAAGSIG